MISPSYRSAIVSASALLPVAVGPRMATTGFTDESADKRERRQAAGPGPVAAAGSLRLFVIEERDGEKRLLRRIFWRQRRRGIRGRERTIGGTVERAYRRRTNHVQVRDRAVLVHIERHDDVPLHGHRRI